MIDRHVVCCTLMNCEGPERKEGVEERVEQIEKTILRLKTVVHRSSVLLAQPLRLIGKVGQIVTSVEVEPDQRHGRQMVQES